MTNIITIIIPQNMHSQALSYKLCLKAMEVLCLIMAHK